VKIGHDADKTQVIDRLATHGFTKLHKLATILLIFASDEVAFDS
jgi:hypothetical protein